MTQREAFEKEIIKVGKALSGLSRYLEKNSSSIDKLDIDKGFYALRQSVDAIEKKAMIDRDANLIAADDFSLAQVDIQKPIGVNYREVSAPKEIDPKISDRVALAKAVGGRFTKAAKAEIASGRVAIPAVDPAPVVDDDDDDLPPVVHDEPDDGVDFIDP